MQFLFIYLFFPYQKGYRNRELWQKKVWQTYSQSWARGAENNTCIISGSGYNGLIVVVVNQAVI